MGRETKNKLKELTKQKWFGFVLDYLCSEDISYVFTNTNLIMYIALTSKRAHADIGQPCLSQLISIIWDGKI